MQEAAQQAGMARVCAGLSKWVCVEGVWIEQYGSSFYSETARCRSDAARRNWWWLAMQLRIVAREPEYSYHGPHYRYALASHWWAPSTIAPSSSQQPRPRRCDHSQGQGAVKAL